MQTSITKISMKINDENDSIKAYASVVFNHSVKINGIQIVENDAGKLIVINYFRQYLDTTLVERYFKLKSALNKTATKGFDPNG